MMRCAYSDNSSSSGTTFETIVAVPATSSVPGLGRAIATTTTLVSLLPTFTPAEHPFQQLVNPRGREI